jgi:pseudaminic acid cytidylyltransferase
MTFLVFLPARGGSKRIPLKNIKSFCGQPAINHVIQLLTELDPNPQVVVSTDSDEIATAAQASGATIYHRDAQLADDYSDLLSVVRADLEKLSNDFPDMTELACVLPTAFLMSTSDLILAVHTARENVNEFVVSVGRFRYPIQRALTMESESSRVSMATPENYFTRSQDLETMYHDAGQFYVGSMTAWHGRETMFSPAPRGIVIDDWRVQDIDVEADWNHAERLWRAIEQES